MSVDLTQPRWAVRHLKNVRIPLPDGITLAADLFMPEGPGPFPAVFEYLPYRKDDRTAARWNAHYYFAERGFAGVRVDLRGTGGSEGVVLDEYLPQEQADACVVIDWISRQPWCTGSVGMFGTSYGGFNAIQTAMHNPPALKAIIPHAATDDRYHCDVHYSGGCLMGIDQLLYPGWMLPMNAMPPYPQYAGADWAAQWQARLHGNPPWLLEWLRHQTEDAFWLQGSLKTDYSSIKAPVLHLGGWQDGYPDALFRMLAGLTAPNRAICGPWQHSRPNDAYPEPRINHLHEMTRWWAQWLRGEDTGIMREPQLAVYVQHGAPAHPFLPHMPGEWRYEPRWPPARTQTRSFYLASAGALRAEPEAGAEADRYRHRATVGTASGFWFPLWPPFGLNREQTVDDARSLTYTSAPLEQPLELLGCATAALHVAADATLGFVSVKVCDVAPDGASTLVTRGILNLTHRKSHAAPEPLTPGETYAVDVPLKVASWVFQPGHCVRVSLATSDFPTVWPSPTPFTLSVQRGRLRPSRLLLPVVAGAADPALPRPVFQPPVALTPRASTSSEPSTWRVTEEAVAGTTSVAVHDCGRVQPVGEPFILEEAQDAEITASDARPEAVSARGVQRISMLQPEARTDLIGRLALRSTATQLHADLELRVTVDGELFFQKAWAETIERYFI
ncbi:MAG: CocE/NonD family hydrolase [Anaerolineales bacterium]|nr:CocE/NonD family hydrolase [Anaerolineales bacterium]